MRALFVTRPGANERSADRLRRVPLTTGVGVGGAKIKTEAEGASERVEVGPVADQVTFPPERLS